MSKQKDATVSVSMLPLGRASYRYQQELQRAAKRGDFCQQQKVTAFNGSYTDNGGRCESLAKMVVDGKPVCGKHASFLMLQAAYKASK